MSTATDGNAAQEGEVYRRLSDCLWQCEVATGWNDGDADGDDDVSVMLVVCDEASRNRVSVQRARSDDAAASAVQTLCVFVCVRVTTLNCINSINSINRKQ